jgi:hypothetical protein
MFTHLNPRTNVHCSYLQQRPSREIRGREMLRNMAETEGVIVLDTGVCVHVLEH